MITIILLKNIRKIFLLFDMMSIDLLIVEIDSDMDWKYAFNDSNIISKSVMLNILDEVKGRYE